jgi:hypothetical protein
MTPTFSGNASAPPGPAAAIAGRSAAAHPIAIRRELRLMHPMETGKVQSKLDDLILSG